MRPGHRTHVRTCVDMVSLAPRSCIDSATIALQAGGVRTLSGVAHTEGPRVTCVHGGAARCALSAEAP